MIRKDITYEERAKIIDLSVSPCYSNWQDIALIGSDLDKEQIDDMDAIDIITLGKEIAGGLMLGKKKRLSSG